MRVAILGLITLLLVPACTNVGQKSGRNTTGNPAVFSGADFSSVSFTHQLSNVNVAQVANGNNGNSTPQVNISLALNTNLAGFKPITQFCGVGTNPCACELKWKQTNSNGEVVYPRTRKVPATTVQSGSVSCLMNQTDWDEIIPGAILALRIMPVGTNASGLNCKSINYRKGSVTNPNGDFLDDALNAFRNIHRYSCHTKRTAPHEILNRFQNISKVSSAPQDGSGETSTDSGAPVKTSVASCFCTAFSGDVGGGGGSGYCSGLPCPKLARSGYSAQNYYRNLYIRSDLLGQINSSNLTYNCPKTLESLKVSATSNSGLTTIPQAEQNKYWPLDSSFALATQWSSEWSIGIMAGSVLLKPGDANTNPASLDVCENSDPRFIENGIFPKCLGYAKPAKSDGTCGTITDSNGNVRPLVRLRRYRAVLPPRFDSNGNVEGAGNQGQQSAIYPAVDEVYVADRLVLDQNALPNGDMIYGPKPCNYAWFDHEGVVNRSGTSNPFNTNIYITPTSGVGIPSYVGTNRFYKNSNSNPSWDPSLSVNPDGLVFPNHDRLGLGIETRDQASCSASIPVVNYTQGQAQAVTLFTANSNRGPGDVLQLGGYVTGSKNIYRSEIHLRPIDPWVPQYLEDTSFKACAPLSSEFTEPPLHFYKDAGGNFAWCAEAYPTQNPYWAEINKKRKVISPTSSADPNQINIANLVSYPSGPAPVSGFTSHGNSSYAGQSACSATPGPQICAMTTPQGSPVNTSCVDFLDRLTDTTCDRTVMFNPFQDYRDFPLLANSSDTEKMLMDDLANMKNLSCAYSVSSDPNKVNRQYPSTGCCGIRNGAPVLSTLISAGASGGHLEPFTDPASPNTRFCGSPVR
ncbi:MAG: hypothetical protein KGP28_11085 [Bdellovibrionales bacterium]|nr:hypothetical protein [Bdellovibrionales bacterium]